MSTNIARAQGSPDAPVGVDHGLKRLGLVQLHLIDAPYPTPGRCEGGSILACSKEWNQQSASQIDKLTDISNTHPGVVCLLVSPGIQQRCGPLKPHGRSGHRVTMGARQKLSVAIGSQWLCAVLVSTPVGVVIPKCRLDLNRGAAHARLLTIWR